MAAWAAMISDQRDLRGAVARLCGYAAMQPEWKHLTQARMTQVGAHVGSLAGLHGRGGAVRAGAAGLGTWFPSSLHTAALSLGTMCVSSAGG